ncbi:MAG: shikimate kinase [Hymenobacter sp.]|nr:MAG: shikimate kinase [Hymenobacter sp.]
MLLATCSTATCSLLTATCYLNNLYLIGLPGSGKTTIGRRLAAHLGWEFRDLDVDIAAQSGQTIPEIFAAEGEAGFRQREAAALRAVALRPGPPLVLATGGGTPCFHDNLAVLHQTGFTLWLDVPVPELVRRLAHSHSTRPLLAASEPSETPEKVLFDRLSRTLAAREWFYAQARLRHAGAATVAAVVAALAQAGFDPA